MSIKYIDQQGFRVKVGIAYLFVFAMPGPDYTALVVEKLNEDGTVSGYVPVFNIRIDDMQPDRLWRPLKYKWDNKMEREYVVKYAGEEALDLTRYI